MEMTYDKSVDACYISLAGEKMENEIVLTDSFVIPNMLEFGIINIDFDSEKKIVGFEILDASKHLPSKMLDNAQIIG